MSNGILPLNNDTLLLLEQKHPKEGEIHEEALLNQPFERIDSLVYDVIYEVMVLQAIHTSYFIQIMFQFFFIYIFFISKPKHLKICQH